jgi:membrane protein insertase Oxa1/YidC/SpoIIIJ
MFRALVMATGSDPFAVTVLAAVSALFLPVFFAIWGLALPLAVTLYYATASVVRLAQQAVFLKAHPW